MIGTILVGLVVLACLGIAAKHIYKLFKGETSCCGTEAPKVNLHRNQATVKMTRDVSDEEIKTALADSGYEVVAITKG